MTKIRVYPTHENARVISHPLDGSLSDAGSMWEEDAFTGRMLADNAVTTEIERRHKYVAAQPDHTRPPAHATGSGVVQRPEEQPPEPVKQAVSKS